MTKSSPSSFASVLNKTVVDLIFFLTDNSKTEFVIFLSKQGKNFDAWFGSKYVAILTEIRIPI